MNAETATPAPPPDADISEQPTVVMEAPAPEGSGAPVSIDFGSEEDLAKSLRMGVVDVSHGVVSKSADYADAHLAEQTSQRGFRGFIKKIWHGNIARDYIRLKKVQEGRERIIESGNMGVLQDGSLAEHDSETAAVVNRFTNEYLHSGERQDSLSDTGAGQDLEGGLRTIVRFFASGQLDEDGLIQEKTRLLDEYKAVLHGEDRNKGLMLADNVLDVARNARAALNHGVAIERIMGVLEARSGEAKIGQRTEARRELTDRIVDKLYGSKVGCLLNETTIAAAVGTAQAIAKVATRKAAAAAAATVTMGLGAGGIAGVREHARVGQERQLHLRERAAGEEAPTEGAKRRNELEETRYNTVSASDLTDSLQQAREAVAAAEPNSINDVLQSITEVEARIRLSDEEAIDLIDYSSLSTIEQERLQLDIALAEAKVDAKRALQSTDETILAASGLSRDLDAVIEDRLGRVNEVLRVDIGAKDAAFAALRRNRTLKMAATGFLVGETLGLGIQEARAAVSDSLQGVFEHGNGQVDRQTLLSAVLGHHASSHHVAEAYTNASDEQAASLHSVALDHHASLELPKDYQLDKTAIGQWNLIGPDGKPVVSGIGVDSHGHLTDASREAMQKAGFNLNDHTENYAIHKLETFTRHRTPESFLEHHPGQFTHVDRQLWYDNNTPNIFDKNELKLWWGGHGDTGIDEHGNYVFNVSQMSPDGSFHDGLSADAQQLIHEGKMAIALSMNQGTQSHVVMVPVDSHGNAIIKADSWMAHSLFEKQNGQARFIGAYAEAVQLMGKHHGVEAVRMLATVVGENNPHHITDITHHLVTHQGERTVTSIVHHPGEHRPVAAPFGIPVEVPVPLPILARSGLETFGEDDAAGNPNRRAQVPYPYLGRNPYVQEGYRDLDDLLPRRGLAPFAPELENNPDAKIDAEASAKRYARSHRPSYKRVLDALEEGLSKEPKSNKPKVVVMIPAAAHQEGRNIHNTLEQYALQQGVEPGDFEIVVFANYPEDAQPDQTISEVRRFQEENPGINVRLIEKKLTKPEQNIGWIRKAVTDTVIEELTERGVPLDDVLLVSNDADSQWINPNYLRTIIRRAEESPETDGFLGFIDWGYDAYKARPEMLASTRFMQMIETYLRIAKHEIGSSGANFAFRPGIYTAVGGYSPGAPLAEDVLLGRMIKSVRAGANTRRPISFLGRSSEVNTSARRALEKLLKDGGAPAAQWDDEFGANDELRTRDFSLENFNFDDEAAIEQMVGDTQRMLNQTLNIYSRSLQASSASSSYRQGRLTMYDEDTIRQLNRIFFFLGIDARWTPDAEIEIVDATKMIDGLKKWQAAH